MQWTTKDQWAAFPLVEPASKKPPNPFDKFDLPSDAKQDAFADLDPKAPAYRADYTIASIVLALALSLYVAARAVGWVLDGFIGSKDHRLACKPSTSTQHAAIWEPSSILLLPSSHLAAIS